MGPVSKLQKATDLFRIEPMIWLLGPQPPSYIKLQYNNQLFFQASSVKIFIELLFKLG